jgi:magnesium/cobalt transport protein CorA
MIFRHQRGAVSWVDLEQPTAEELSGVMREFNISERIESELALPSPLPISASEGTSTVLVLHFPTHDDNDESHEQEVDIVAGKNFIVTVRYEVVPPLHALHKSLEAHELLGLAPNITPDELLELILGKIFDSVRDHTKHIASRLARVEREMFSGNERTTVRAISGINREFLHLESALADNEEPLAHFLGSLERHGFYGAHFAERAGRILAERDHLARLITTHRAIATELQQTNTALLNATQNEIMKTLTVVTFIFLPLELIAGIFAMDNTLDMPLVHNPHGFIIIMAMMAITAAGLTLFFARRRWL